MALRHCRVTLDVINSFFFTVVWSDIGTAPATWRTHHWRRFRGGRAMQLRAPRSTDNRILWPFCSLLTSPAPLAPGPPRPEGPRRRSSALCEGRAAAQAPCAFPAARVRAGPARPLPPPERSRVDCPESASPAPPPPPQVSPGHGSDEQWAVWARRREGRAGGRHRSVAALRGRPAEGEAMGASPWGAGRGGVVEVLPIFTAVHPGFPRCAPHGRAPVLAGPQPTIRAHPEVLSC